MGRTREYDEATALSGAMHAFRRKGFAAVSVRELEKATRLKIASIYNSFGDKAGLFEAAFAHYNQTVLGGRIARHAPESAGLAGLRKLFLTLLEEPRGESFGCLITNSAVEFGGAESVPGGVAAGLTTLAETFTQRLAATGLPAQRASDLALRLLALYQGTLVLIRAGWDKRALARYLDDEFDRLEQDHDA
jgi:AcrR family transcriptional regulator